MNTPSRAKRLRHFLEWLLIAIASQLVPLLPHKLLCFLARAASRLGYLVDRRGRTTALENLACALGDTHSLSERRRIARRSYQSFARTWFELFWSKRLTSKNYPHRMKIEWRDPAIHDLIEKKGAILCCLHYGNFEWLSYACMFSGHPFWVIAEDFKNPRLTELFRTLRERQGQKIISQEGAMLKLLKHVKRRGAAAMLSDLTVPPTQAATIIRCFGLETSVSLLHAALYQRTGAPLIPAECLPQEDGTYRMVFHPPLSISPEASLQEIAQACWDVFEPTVRAHPEHWLWMYKHWRYRPKNTEENYPPYANPSRQFENLRTELRNENFV